MSDSPVHSSAKAVGDDAVVKATGRSGDEWFALLDAAGAADWKHPDIAAWLGETHDMPAWWCQSVTVAYEQARGIRLPGQRPDGTFEASSSKTLPLEQHAALDVIIGIVTGALGGSPAGQNRSVNFITAKWPVGDGESILARVGPATAGRASVTLTHQRLAGATGVAAAKAELQSWLAAAAAETEPASGAPGRLD